MKTIGHSITTAAFGLSVAMTLGIFPNVRQSLQVDTGEPMTDADRAKALDQDDFTPKPGYGCDGEKLPAGVLVLKCGHVTVCRRGER